MKALIPVVLLAALVGCASSYRTVYTSAEGDYYIEEESAQGIYFVPESVLYAGIGFEPWWITFDPSMAFIYYYPNYYPYYLSGWYSLAYQPLYGYYPGYYSYWCPPYRTYAGHPHANPGRIAGRRVVAPLAGGRATSARWEKPRSTQLKNLYPAFKPGSESAHGTIGQSWSGTTFMNAPGKPSRSAPAMGTGRSSGFARPSSVTFPADRSLKTSALPFVRDKQ